MTKSLRIITLVLLFTLEATTPARAASQTISFDAIASKILGVSPFAITAQASSGLAVNFTSTTPAVCRASSNLITILKAGVCSITAGQTGNSTYSAAAPVKQTFNVNTAKPSGTLSAAPGSPNATGTVPLSAPLSAVVGDFNGDGVEDIAVTVSSNNIVIMLGTGSGGFGSPAVLPLIGGTYPNSITIGDFNGDGIADLATANLDSNNVTILLGNGSGGFNVGPGSPFAVGPLPYSIVTGDFNGDGIQDLATANNAGDSITVLLGNGAGGFTDAPGSPYEVQGQAPVSIAVADFNGDGIQDLAIADFSSDDVTVLLGGAGGFTAVPNGPLATGTGPFSIAVGDFNGDGISDLVTANIFDSDVTVLLGDGRGGFTEATGSPFAVGTGPASVVVGDFNGDGIQDLVTANNGNTGSVNNVTVLLGNGAGGFTPITGNLATAGSFPEAVVTGDFNGDGIEDLAVADYGSNDVMVMLGGLTPTTSGLSTTSQSPVPSGQSVSLTLNVSDSAGAFSAPTGGATFSNGGTIMGTATQTAPPYSFTANNLSDGIHTLTATYAGDPRNAASASNTLTVKLGQTSQTAPSTTASYSISPTSASVGMAGGSGTVSVTTSPAGAAWTASSNASWLYIISAGAGPGAGTISWTVAASSGPSRSGTMTIAGQTFTVTQKNSSSVAGVFRNNSQWVLQADANQPSGLVYNNFVNPVPGDMPVVGDWSGSGNTKIGIYRPTTGTWFLDYNGDGVFDIGDLEYQFGGVAGDIPVVGDWSGTGTAKIGLVRPFSPGGQPALWILDYNGNGILDSADQVFAFGGVTGDIPVVGDWTGDGKAKVGVVRPFAPGGQAALWILDANNNHAIDSGDLIFAYGGITGDVPVVGDWSGTGTAKVGVVRPFAPGGTPALWITDYNGSAPTTLGGTDNVVFPFGGIAGDKQVVGSW